MSTTIQTPTGGYFTIACGPEGRVRVEIRQVGSPARATPVQVVLNLTHSEAWQVAEALFEQIGLHR